MSMVRSIATASGRTRFRCKKTMMDLLEKNGCTLTGFADGPGGERNVACDAGNDSYSRHLLELNARSSGQGSP